MTDKKRYLVEGAYLDGNDGSPITTDYVVAASADEAREIVTKVREKSGDDWVLDRAIIFEYHIRVESQQLAEMEAMTLEDVENSWSETKAGLYYEEEEEEETDA